MKIRKLFSFIMSATLLFSYSPKMSADVWNFEDCVDKVRNIGVEYKPSAERFNIFCVKNYVLLDGYLRNLEIDPSLAVPVELSDNISRELDEAASLANQEYTDWLGNLAVLKEAFLYVWQENVPNNSYMPFVRGKSGLYAPAPSMEHFKNFIRKNHKSSMEMPTLSFRNICFRKYFALDKFIRYLSMIERAEDPERLKISGEDISAMSEELLEVDKFAVSGIKDYITIFRTMRDELLLVLNMDIYHRPYVYKG